MKSVSLILGNGLIVYVNIAMSMMIGIGIPRKYNNIERIIFLLI
jgi:hypothetical protein